VSLHAPAGPGTEKMMDDAAFARMKKGSFLVNTARAALVDEGALIRALESGRLGGAALDVFSVEPPSRDDPLVAHPRVIVTPHLGGNTVELAAHQGEAAVRQIALLLKGQAPEHLLNREVLDRFAWTGPRREPTPAEIERLKEKKGPSMTS
jgi:autoinducer 2 (AI-2) kinase